MEFYTSDQLSQWPSLTKITIQIQLLWQRLLDKIGVGFGPKVNSPSPKIFYIICLVWGRKWGVHLSMTSLFEMILFLFFHPFYFSNTKKTKTKILFWFENPFFDTRTTCKTNIFSPLHTICDLKNTQNTIELGKQAKHLGPSFDPTLWTKSRLQKAKSWTEFWLYSI